MPINEYSIMDFSNVIIDDNLILSIFYNDKNKINPRYWKILKYPNFVLIKDYLENRFKDAESWCEIFYRILHKIEIRPTCAICGSKVKFSNAKHFFKTCSEQCRKISVKRTIETTNLEKYGTTCSLVNPEIRKKSRETMIQKFGVETPMHSEQIKNRVKSTCLERYGTIHNWSNEEIRNKCYFTKKEKGTFNSSKIEESCYIWLCEEYGSDNVQRQYNKDPRYPFLCDFYISSIDLFIEIQGHWTHGPHPFDPSNPEDIGLLEFYKEKAKTSKYYQRAVRAFGNKDPFKREIAKKNNIRFLEMWSADFSKQDLLNAIQEALKSSI